MGDSYWLLRELVRGVVAGIDFHLDSSPALVRPKWFALPIRGLIVVYLNYFKREVILISITLPLSSFLSFYIALYIIFTLYKSALIVTGSSWTLQYFNLRWTGEANVSKVIAKGLPDIQLQTVLHGISKKLQSTLLVSLPPLKVTINSMYPQGWVTVSLKAHMSDPS